METDYVGGRGGGLDQCGDFNPEIFSIGVDWTVQKLIISHSAVFIYNQSYSYLVGGFDSPEATNTIQ